MSRIIACMNEKGGSGKTTTVKNLSVKLAQNGKKVLAIDLDPSANLTSSLGIRPREDAITILDILKLSKECDDIPENYGIIHHDEGIDLITSRKALHDFESELNAAFQKEVVLRRFLNDVKDQYDYIFVDCPAGLGIFTVNALFSADAVIIPVQPQFLGADAMQVVFEYIARVRKMNGTKSKPEILGIVFTMVRVNTINDKEIMTFFRQSYEAKIKVFDTYIPTTVKFSESDGVGQSIYKYASKSTAAMIYSDFVKEFMDEEQRRN
ncbi:MAG: ParA family protein [Roseburia sp.]|nr:ParA family protein [Roseburia sp.]